MWNELYWDKEKNAVRTKFPRLDVDEAGQSQACPPWPIFDRNHCFQTDRLIFPDTDQKSLPVIVFASFFRLKQWAAMAALENRERRPQQCVSTAFK